MKEVSRWKAFVAVVCVTLHVPASRVVGIRLLALDAHDAYFARSLVEMGLSKANLR